MPRVILAGGPGVGKTTLLRALASAGHRTVDESARELIRERVAQGLAPRPDAAAFAREMLRRDLQRYEQTGEAGWTFFDRSPLEALAMLRSAGGVDHGAYDAWRARFDFHPTVFLLPPWPDIYVQDAERDHPFEHCVRVHDELVGFYTRCGFVLSEVPRAEVQVRVQHVLRVLAGGETPSEGNTG